MDFVKKVLFITLARLCIFRRQKTQQMFLTGLSAGALSDEIGKMGRIHKTTVFSLAFTVCGLQLTHMRLPGMHVTTILHAVPIQ